MSVSRVLFILLAIIYVEFAVVQEVIVSLQEEIVLDIVPCEPGSLDCLAPSIINNRILRSGNNEEESSHVIQTLYYFSTEQNVNTVSDNTIIDVEILIHRGLNVRPMLDQSRFNDDDLNITVDVFHEFISLDVDPSSTSSQCPQGFQTVWEQGILTELIVCPNRLKKEDVDSLMSNYSLGADAFPLGPNVFLQPSLVGGGYQSILIDQEYLISIPCSPGMFCSQDEGNLFLRPQPCPPGTYNSMYGQKQESDCSPCPFSFTTKTIGSVSLDQCHNDSQTLETFTIFSTVIFLGLHGNMTLVDTIEAQYILKREISNWASGDNNSKIIYILSWDL